MGKIIAIGGGEIGSGGSKLETLSIDKETVKLTGKSSPKLLFLPTASGDAPSYVDTVNKYFGKRFGCQVEALLLFKNKYSKKELEDKILNADIIYVGGGNTLKMMKQWRKLEVDVLLRKAYQKGIVLAGVSAGANCWFRYSNSDSARFTKSDSPMIRVAGLGLLNILVCPHYNVEKEREVSVKAMMKKTPGIAVALDNCTALEVVDDGYRILRSKPTAYAYKVYWQQGKYFKKEIPVTKKFSPLAELLSK